MKNIKIFGLDNSYKFAQQVASRLDIPCAKQLEKAFDDGELYTRSNSNVRGSDVYVIYSLYSDNYQSVNDKLVKLLFFIGSLKDASAKRVTLVAQHLCYARQDRKTESRAPIGQKYLVQCLESVGLNRILTLDIHNLAACQNAFRIPTDNLEAKNLFANYLCGVGVNEEGIFDVDRHIDHPLIENPTDIAVLSPDSGSMGRAKRFRTALEKRLSIMNKIEVVYLDKERKENGEVTGDKIIGNVKGKRVIVDDDMIATGSTMKRAALAVKSHGGELWAVCATHGLFVGDANENLASVPNLIITDSIPPFRLDEVNAKKLHVVPTIGMIAQAIKRTHENGSISSLLN